jgi:hypothetical protein
MFWKKKQMVEVPVAASSRTAIPLATTPVTAKVQMPSKMKEEGSKAAKLPGPREIPDPVQRCLITEYKMDPDLATILKSVVRKNAEGEKSYDIRIFDEAESLVKKVDVKNYSTLDDYPSLILYEGSFDEQSKLVKLDERRKVNYDVPLLSGSEILNKIESMSEPGSTVFFYQARGPASGGPLGRGAAMVELNPEFQNKKQKRYILYTVNVDGMEPVLSSKDKLMQSDNSKELAKWIKEAHHERTY